MLQCMSLICMHCPQKHSSSTRMHEAQASNTDFIFTSFWSVLREPLCNVSLLGAAIAISRRIAQQVEIAGGNAWCGEAAYQLVAENELVKIQSDANEGAGEEEVVVGIFDKGSSLRKGLARSVLCFCV